MLDGCLEMCSVTDEIGKAMEIVILFRSAIASARESGQRGADCNSESNEEMRYCFQGEQYNGIQDFIAQARWKRNCSAAGFCCQ